MGLLVGLSGEASAASRKKSNKAVEGVVNLNTANVSQLDVLPGVGEKAAKRIIEYRTKTAFIRSEDLVRVKGFGKKKFEKLKAHLSVSGPTTLKSVKARAEMAPPTAQGRSAPLQR
jgi:competence protein ComEA